MKPTKGKLTVSRGGVAGLDEQGEIVAAMWRSGRSSTESKANCALIVAAWNAAQEINPDNPIVAAEAMPEVMQAVRGTLNAYGHDGAVINSVKCRQAISRLRAAFLRTTEQE